MSLKENFTQTLAAVKDELDAQWQATLAITPESYDELKDRPIAYNKDTKDIEILDRYDKINNLTADNWNNEENDYYTANLMIKKFEGTINSTNDKRVQIPIQCEVGDTIFVLVTAYDRRGEAQITPTSDGWTQLTDFQGGWSEMGMWTYSYGRWFVKKATSTNEIFSANGGDRTFVQAMAISGVKDYKVWNNYNSGSANLTIPDNDGATLFGLIDNMNVDRQNLVTFKDEDDAIIYTYQNRNHLVLTTVKDLLVPKTGDFSGRSQSYYPRPLVVSPITLYGVKSTEAIIKFSGEFTLVQNDEDYDNTKVYYHKAIATYNGSEIATKADLGGGSAELTDEELLELLEVTDLVDTVNVIIGGVEYKLADTDGSVLYFY